MTLEIQLYIEGKEIELYRDESVTLTQSIQDIRDIEKVFTEFSRTFNVPASKPNNKIFKHFHNFFIDGFDARTKKDAELHINYKPFKKGKVKLEGVQLKNNEPQSYKLTFFGESVSLKDILGDDDLSILNQLNVLSFDYTTSNVTTYMTNGLDTNVGLDQLTETIIFPLITHTDRLTYNEASTDAGTNNIFIGSDSNVRGVNLNQLKPAIRIHAIIEAIQLKYNIEFSNDFFNTTNLPYFNLYMWLHSTQGGLFEENEVQYPIENFTNVRGDVDVIQYGGGSGTFVNNYVEDKVDRRMEVLVNPSTSGVYNLVVKLDGKEFQRFDGLSGITVNGQSDATERISFDIPNGRYTFYIESTSAQTFAVEVRIAHDPNSWFRSKKMIKFDGTATVGVNEKIDITTALPKMKVIDFITGLWKMFNLTSFVNDQGVIVVQTLDEFYENSTAQWNITKYLDKDDSIVDAVIPYRQVNLGYKGTDTFLAKNHELSFHKKWGELNYQASEKYDGDAYNIMLPFEHMKFEHFKYLLADTGLQWGWSVDENQSSFVGKPLLFYPVKSVESIAVQTFEGTRANVLLPYMPSNSQFIVNNIFRFDTSQSTNFHPEFDEFDGSPNQTTLFKTYYETYLSDLFDIRKRLTSVSAYLPMSIAQKMTLADDIIIFDRFYRINKMTTNYETGKTEFELVNILQPRKFVHASDNIDVDTTTEDVTVDSTQITVDLTSLSIDGFLFPGDPVIDNKILSNIISSNTTEPCEVTQADVVINDSTVGCDFLKFSAQITSAGFLCGQENIDEYGWLIANAASTLTASNDIDTLKADGNISVFNVVRETNEPSLTVGIKSVRLTGLTDPQSKSARFFVRTNISDEFEKSDYISSVITRTTDCTGVSTADTTLLTADDTDTIRADAGDTDGDGQVDSQNQTQFFTKIAGYGTYGYNTTPDYDTILDNSRYPTNGIDQDDTAVLFFHNGTEATPQIGDMIKWTDGATYSGGNNNTPLLDGSGTTFYALAVHDQDRVNTVNNSFIGPIEKYVIVNHSTGVVTSEILEAPKFLGTLIPGKCFTYGFTSAGRTASEYIHLLGVRQEQFVGQIGDTIAFAPDLGQTTNIPPRTGPGGIYPGLSNRLRYVTKNGIRQDTTFATRGAGFSAANNQIIMIVDDNYAPLAIMQCQPQLNRMNTIIVAS